jgi:hypothetical protein
MRIVKYILFLSLVWILPIVAISEVNITDNKPKKGGIASVWQESQNYELKCWQNGQQIMNEKGFGSISLGNELLGHSITLHSSNDSKRSGIIIGIQKSLCMIRNN